MTFQQKLESGQKVITAEITPPHAGEALGFREMAQLLKSHFDALNVTDNQRALMRMCNLASASILEQEGVEAIYQLTCRDRNTLALQSDLLGAQALGIKNVLCLTGDPVKAGHFEAKSVFEIESVGLLKMIKKMREGLDTADKKLTTPLKIYPGAVVNPSVKNPKIQMKRMERKINAGAKFFQSQAIFSADLMFHFMKQVETFKVPVIAGVLIIQRLKTAHFLNEKVPGVFVSDELLKRLEKDPLEEGFKYAIELSRDLLSMCQGVHLMTIRNEEILIDIVQKGKLKDLKKI